MTESLKNCPFCGGAPSITERPDSIDSTQFFYAITCYCGHYYACAHKMAIRKTPEIAKADAIAAWNTRAPQPSQAQAVAVPLTDEQIVGVMHSIPINAAPSYHIAFARAIEQAHGIGIKNGDSHA